MVNGVKVVAGLLVALAEIGALVVTVLVVNTIHEWHCPHSPGGILAIVLIAIIVSGASGVVLFGMGLYAVFCCCKGGSQVIKKPWFLFLRPLGLYAVAGALYGVARFVVKAPEGCHVNELHLFLLIGIPLFASICVFSLLAFLFTCREPAEEEEEEIEKAPLAGTPKRPVPVKRGV